MLLKLFVGMTVFRPSPIFRVNIFLKAPRASLITTSLAQHMAPKIEKDRVKWHADRAAYFRGENSVYREGQFSLRHMSKIRGANSFPRLPIFTYLSAKAKFKVVPELAAELIRRSPKKHASRRREGELGPTF